MVKKKSDFDVLVIGAGPAGLSAAIWCTELGLSSAVFEREKESGGQLLHIYNHINNYPGCFATNGRELRDRFLENTSKSKARFIIGSGVSELEIDDLSVTTADGRRFSGASVIFATGVRRRQLNVPGETEFVGRGIMSSGAKEPSEAADKTVAIIGGGDAALENSLILADFAKQVYLIHRRGDFSARSEFVKTALAHPKIEFLFNSEVQTINGNEILRSIGLKDRGAGKLFDLAVDKLLIRIGVEPNSELLKNKVKLDRRGYVVVNQVGSTNVPAIYAVGDVANPVSPTIATSVGTAAAAVKHIASGLADKVIH